MTDSIVISKAKDAVTVIAVPTHKVHQGRIAYGTYKVGQAYTVDAEEAARLIAHKGFTEASKPATPPTSTHSKE